MVVLLKAGIRFLVASLESSLAILVRLLARLAAKEHRAQGAGAAPAPLEHQPPEATVRQSGSRPQTVTRGRPR